ncbi:MAG: hypothetical protein DI547_16195 [Sphingobium sp.]|nr:MAG: hypothetical protein DI547_16195 [Sphingobium sp.]
MATALTPSSQIAPETPARPMVDASRIILPPLGRVHRNPAFWSDLEVRQLVVEMHRQVTINAALEIIAQRVGAERTPTKSAIARAWKRLDLLTKPKRRGGR